MQVLEDLGAQQLRLVEEKHGMDLLAAELLHVVRELPEHRCGGRLRFDGQCSADVPIEVAETERRIVAIGEPETRCGKMTTKRAEQTRLPDAGLSDDDGVLVFVYGFDEGFEDIFARRREPEVTVVDVLGEGRRREAEVS